MQSVLDRFMGAYQHTHRLSPRQRQVCAHLQRCRTEVLGGLKRQCDHCDYESPHYRACRDRHCPRCQHRASRLWGERQQDALLPVSYYHLVFTLPPALNPWVRLHPELIYALLFQSVWATLKAFGADPKRLGGELGMTAVLRTWGETLSQHVHLHCLVPGGVLTREGRWHEARSNYLFPVRALSRHFRGRTVSALRKAYACHRLHRVTRAGDIERMLDTLMRGDWVVYSKSYRSHTDTVIGYLARYSHRIAISERRIVGIEGDQVAFGYKDYRDGGQHKVMRLAGEEFIRRFLLHVLPKGLMRIRHFGFLANRCRQTKLARIRTCLKDEDNNTGTAEEQAKAAEPQIFAAFRCPKCCQGYLRVCHAIAPGRLKGGG